MYVIFGLMYLLYLLIPTVGMCRYLHLLFTTMTDVYNSQEYAELHIMQVLDCVYVLYSCLCTIA